MTYEKYTLLIIRGEFNNTVTKNEEIPASNLPYRRIRQIRSGNENIIVNGEQLNAYLFLSRVEDLVKITIVFNRRIRRIKRLNFGSFILVEVR